MGIDYNAARLLAFCKRAGVDFKATAMIGRQTLDATTTEYKAIFGVPGLSRETYSEPLFEALGAATVDSVDVNDYERATILHNMNEPIPDRLRERFTFVLDGGALEHIFNFPIAIQNCMDMVAPGGHFVAGVPANNWTGHGFYQFSPELYFRVLAPEYGFEVVELFLATRLTRGKWYRVSDPAAIKRRVVFSNSRETSLYVVARKTKTLPLSPPPFQSDYAMLEWQGADPVSKQLPQDVASKAARAIVRALPDAFADRLRNAKANYRFLRSLLGGRPGLEKVAIESLPA